MKRLLWMYVAGTALSAPALAQTGLPPVDQTPVNPAPAKPDDTATAVAPGPAAADNGQIEDIVVTAQRRSENLQRVPIAVTAVTSAALTRTAVRDVTDLVSVVPGLNITNEIGFVTSQLRGVGSNLVSVGFENPVAIYVDGVYYASPSASNVNFSSIERVEVLKGPQGTLFGRNATGGLINIVTRDPSHTLGGAANISYGNYDTVAGDAYLTGGLTDTVAIDLAVQGAHQGKGWGTNIGTGNDNYRIDRDLGARSKLVFETAGTKVSLTGDYSRYHNSLNAQVLFPGTFSAYGGGPSAYPGRYDTDTNVDHSVDGYNWGVSLTIEHDLGFARAKSITAYRRAKLLNIIDVDETPLPAIAFSMSQHDRQLSQEFQLLSKGDGPFTWVVGAYYFDARGKWDPFRLTIAQPISPIPIFVDSFDTIGTNSIAGYAQGTLALGARTKATVGARITDETRAREAYETTTVAADTLFPVAPGVLVPFKAGTPLGPPSVFPRASLKYDRVTFRVAVDHQFTDDILGYVSFNRGFKSGGYNPAIYDQALLVGGTSYQPEKLDAWEVGLKTSLFDRRVRFNAAAFYYDYSNLQLPLILQTTAVTINGAQARIYGVDGDIEARLTDALRFTGGFQLIDDKYVRFPRAPIGTLLGGVPLTVGSADGHQLNSVPSVTLNGGLDYTATFASGGVLTLAGNVSYDGGYYLHPDNIRRQGPYALVNSTIKYVLPSGISLGVYGKNLGDVRRVAAFQVSTGGDQSTQWAAPRTYGVTLGYKF